MSGEVLAHSLKEDVNYRVNDDFLKKKGLWCHAKNLEAINYLKKLNVNFFWHEESDEITITSKKLDLVSSQKLNIQVK